MLLPLEFGRLSINCAIVESAPSGRLPDPQRHKILDAIGDLALLGLPVIGHLHTYKCGHALTHELLRELYREREAWSIETLGDEALVADAQTLRTQPVEGTGTSRLVAAAAGGESGASAQD